MLRACVLMMMGHKGRTCGVLTFLAVEPFFNGVGAVE